jgi:MSHA biogenesis protein MshM
VMPEATLEQVRLLSNLESSRHKLLHMVLFGQPELDETLAKTSLRQLRDRVTHSFRMRPLAPPEVAKYLAFRMRAAGYRGPDLFVPRAAALLARASEGLTRRINILADKALLAAYSEGSHAVTVRHVRAAIADSEFAAIVRRRWRPAVWLAAALAAALAAGVALGLSLQWLEPAREPKLHAALPMPAVKPAPEPVPEPDTGADLEEEIDAIAEEEDLAQPLLSSTQLRRLQGYRTAGQKLLGERVAATRELLERAPDERYAVELFVTDNADPARTERFLMRAQELVPLAELYVIPMQVEGGYRLRVVYGEFDNAEAALEAGRRLPPKYQQAFRAVPRSFGELRKQL